MKDGDLSNFLSSKHFYSTNCEVTLPNYCSRQCSYHFFRSFREKFCSKTSLKVITKLETSSFQLRQDGVKNIQIDKG